MKAVRCVPVPCFGLIKRYSVFVPCFEVLFPSVVYAAVIVLCDDSGTCVPLGEFCSTFERRWDGAFLGFVLDIDRGAEIPLLVCLGDGLELLMVGSRKEVVRFGSLDVELLIIFGFRSPFFNSEPFLSSFPIFLPFSVRRRVSGVDSWELFPDDCIDARLDSIRGSKLFTILGPVPLRGVSGGVIDWDDSLLSVN